jgi:hypothetical protein
MPAQRSRLTPAPAVKVPTAAKSEAERLTQKRADDRRKALAAVDADGVEPPRLQHSECYVVTSSGYYNLPATHLLSCSKGKDGAANAETGSTARTLDARNVLAINTGVPDKKNGDLARHYEGKISAKGEFVPHAWEPFPEERQQQIWLAPLVQKSAKGDAAPVTDERKPCKPDGYVLGGVEMYTNRQILARYDGYNALFTAKCESFFQGFGFFKKDASGNKVMPAEPAEDAPEEEKKAWNAMRNRFRQRTECLYIAHPVPVAPTAGAEGEVYPMPVGQAEPHDLPLSYLYKAEDGKEVSVRGCHWPDACKEAAVGKYEGAEYEHLYAGQLVCFASLSADMISESPSRTRGPALGEPGFHEAVRKETDRVSGYHQKFRAYPLQPTTVAKLQDYLKQLKLAEVFPEIINLAPIRRTSTLDFKQWRNLTRSNLGECPALEKTDASDLDPTTQLSIQWMQKRAALPFEPPWVPFYGYKTFNTAASGAPAKYELVEFPNGRLKPGGDAELEVVHRHRRADKNAAPWLNIQDLEKTHPDAYHARQVALHAMYNRTFDKSGSKRKASGAAGGDGPECAARIAELEEQLDTAQKRVKTLEAERLDAADVVPDTIELDAGYGNLNKPLTIVLKTGDATVLFKMPNGGEATTKMRLADQAPGGLPTRVKASGAFKLTFDGPEEPEPQNADEAPV